jgi:3-oxoacyl-[acyl-carrier-protein] synthase I
MPGSNSNKRRVVVTGLGFITSIGNTRADVLTSLRECRTGIEYYPELERSGVHVRLAGTVKEFSFPELRSDEWTYPAQYEIPREHLRSLSPHGVYGFCAMEQAIVDAQLTSDLVSNPRTGVM